MLANVVLDIFWTCFGFIVVRGRAPRIGGRCVRPTRLKCKYSDHSLGGAGITLDIPFHVCFFCLRLTGLTQSAPATDGNEKSVRRPRRIGRADPGRDR